MPSIEEFGRTVEAIRVSGTGCLVRKKLEYGGEELRFAPDDFSWDSRASEVVGFTPGRTQYMSVRAAHAASVESFSI